MEPSASMRCVVVVTAILPHDADLAALREHRAYARLFVDVAAIDGVRHLRHNPSGPLTRRTPNGVPASLMLSFDLATLPYPTVPRVARVIRAALGAAGVEPVRMWANAFCWFRDPDADHGPFEFEIPLDVDRP